MQDLGKCIIEILSNSSLKEHDLVITFCATLQKNCLEIFQLAEHFQSPSENVGQIMNFLLLLDRHAVQKGETWPLELLAGPMVTKAFPLIRSLDSADAVKLLSVTVLIFGPRKIVSLLGHSGSSPVSDEDANESKSKNFLEVFKEIFVPWCLHGSNDSTSARLDLLLALRDDELFAEQWCSIVIFATRPEECPGTEIGSFDFDHIVVLAMLMEKVRREIDKRRVSVEYNHRKGVTCGTLASQVIRFNCCFCCQLFSSLPDVFLALFTVLLICADILLRIIPHPIVVLHLIAFAFAFLIVFRFANNGKHQLLPLPPGTIPWPIVGKSLLYV